jgi:hypothetical protein
MKKTLIGLGVGTLLLIGVAVFFVTRVLGSLDQIVQEVIQTTGTELTGVPVSVGGVKIDLSSGAGTITGLQVGNPKGYQARNAFQMDLLKVAIDIKAAAEGKVVISEVIIDSPIVEVEMRDDGSSNLAELASNVSANVSGADADTPDADSEPEAADGEPTQLTIKQLLIEGVTFNLIAPEREPITGNLPTIKLSNVSGTPSQIGEIVITELTNRILKEAVENYLRDKIESKFEKSKEKLLDKLRN